MRFIDMTDGQKRAVWNRHFASSAYLAGVRAELTDAEAAVSAARARVAAQPASPLAACHLRLAEERLARAREAAR
ncbi:hypothetical protein [Roseomonas indoligenes]|uniref:Uncharacterized protein n=1 Tax=Roseomonas indoligenes TaxID=2820811 RepID=A0A940S6K0_9PROT|nr:hypothetical protein [Pararoseomonas indoligenes]MBP0492132.1 hypothetical protein [Pararoseomonas indoligenes]